MDDVLKKSHEGPNTNDVNMAKDQLRQNDIKPQTFRTEYVSTKNSNEEMVDRNTSKNKMLIFNQENFDELIQREGTDTDVAALKACFERRAFKVECFKDCKRDELFKHLEEATSKDLSMYSCFAILILTYGSYDGLLMSKDRPIYESEIVDALKGSNTPALHTKPKILIIQVGEYYSTPLDSNNYDRSKNKNYAHPTSEEPDFLIIRDMFPRMSVDRRKECGTWFIQSLCKFIDEYELCEDVSAILTHVRHDVFVNHEKAEDKQRPEVTRIHTKMLYLNNSTEINEETDNSEENTSTMDENTSTMDENTSTMDPTKDESQNQNFQIDNDTTKYFNKRFLKKNAKTYELEKFTKNKMLIFNQENCRGATRREGTDKDVDALKTCFEKQAFEVKCFKDCGRDELFRNIEKEIQKDLSDYGCFAVVILTHGSHDGLLKTTNYPFYEHQIVDILKPSNAPSLLTKPKILIIQACRGDDVSRAVKVGQIPHSAPYQYDSLKIEVDNYSIAEESDFFILNATFPGMKAHRNKQNGTWFIQSFCKSVNESKPHEDISAIVTHVRRNVAIDYGTGRFTLEEKQVPEERSTLTRKLCLNSVVNATTTSFGMPPENVANA